MIRFISAVRLVPCAALLIGHIALTGCDGPADPDGGTVDARLPDGSDPTSTFMVAFEPIALEDPPASISDFAFLPSGDELVLAVHAGEVRHYRLEGDAAVLLGSFSFPVEVGRECGLIGVTPDPDFAANGYLYLSYCETPSRAVVSRIALDVTDYAATAATAVEVIAIESDDGVDYLHNFGSVLFDDEGVAWLTAGEKGDGAAARDPSRILGSLLRFHPSVEPAVGGYTPAAGNGFEGDGDPAVYAIGLRSPWRGAFGRHGFWVADVGEAQTEELNIITAAGQNLGWDEWEGPCESDCEGLVDPIVFYDRETSHPYIRDDPEAGATRQRAIYVSPEYAAPPGADPYDGALDDRVFFGDFAVGFMRTLLVDESLQVLEDRHVGHLEGPSAFEIGTDGYYYVTQFGGFDASRPTAGALHRLVLIEPDGG